MSEEASICKVIAIFAKKIQAPHYLTNSATFLFYFLLSDFMSWPSAPFGDFSQLSHSVGSPKPSVHRTLTSLILSALFMYFSYHSSHPFGPSQNSSGFSTL